MSAPEALLEAVWAATSHDRAAPAEDGHDWLDRVVALTRDPDGAPASPSLDALLGGPAIAEGAAAEAAGPMRLPLGRIHPAPHPSRRRSDPEAAARLAASLAEHGLLQPLLVRRRGADYEIVAGTRRYEAAKLADLAEVPVVVLELSDREARLIALVENLQREDLPALDEAQCYFHLLDESGWTQDELARQLGRSRSHITNTLRLLGLPSAVRNLLDSGALSAGHARALLAAPDPAAMAARVVARKLSVRQTELMVRGTVPARRGAARPRLDEAASRFERSLASELGLTVRLQPQRRGGRVTIYYRSTDELADALRRYGTASEPPPA